MYVLSTILKYIVATLIFTTIIRYVEKSSWGLRLLLSHPWIVFLIPFVLIGLLVVTYTAIPDCSFAYITFLIGYLVGKIFGTSPYEPTWAQSQFARKYGPIADVLSNIIIFGSIIWGIANFF